MFQLLVGIAVRTVRFAGRIGRFFPAAQVFFNFTIASTATSSSFSNVPFTGHRSPPCRSVGACTCLTSRWCVGHSFKPKTRRETGLVGAGRHKTRWLHAQSIKGIFIIFSRGYSDKTFREKTTNITSSLGLPFRCASIFCAIHDRSFSDCLLGFSVNHSKFWSIPVTLVTLMTKIQSIRESNFELFSTLNLKNLSN